MKTTTDVCDTAVAYIAETYNVDLAAVVGRNRNGVEINLRSMLSSAVAYSLGYSGWQPDDSDDECTCGWSNDDIADSSEAHDRHHVTLAASDGTPPTIYAGDERLTEYGCSLATVVEQDTDELVHHLQRKCDPCCGHCYDESFVRSDDQEGLNLYVVHCDREYAEMMRGE